MPSFENDVININGQEINKDAVDDFGSIFECHGTVTITDGGAGYAPGCEYRRDDGGGATTTFLNTGDRLSCLFVESPGAGGGITFDGGTPDGAILKKTSATTIGEVTGIPESLIVASHELASFTHDAGVTEKGGTVNNFDLDWAYNRDGDDPASQTIDNGIGAIAVGLRSHSVVGAGLIANTTYQIDAVGDDATPSSLQTTVQFQNKRYWGIDETVLVTDADVLANLASEEFDTSRPVTKTFDASAGSPPNYLYFAWPVAWGAPSEVRFGGFVFTDYSLTTIVGFTNASGWSEDYYLLRTNPTYNGAGLTLQVL